MGIAQDIRPKRNNQHKEKAIFSPEDLMPKIRPESQLSSPEPVLKETAAEHHESAKNKLEDEFFETKSQPKKSFDKPPRSERKLWKTVLWLMLFLFIIAYAFYESNIKSKQSTAGDSPETQKEETYTGEIIPQDYTEKNAGTTATESSDTQSSDSTIPATSPITSEAPAEATSQPIIRLLNGNGINGAAQKAKTTLEKAGYTIGFIGNAKKFTYTQTYIYYKTGADQTAKSIQAVLTGYDTVLQLSDVIAGTNDIVIVIGKK